MPSKRFTRSISEWLMLTARELGIRGATIVSASEGFGHDCRIHLAHFFELADQPPEGVMVVTEEELKRLFAMIEREGVHVFHAKTAIEFGMLGEPSASP